MTWARWIEVPGNKRVASTELGHCWVSTVFLGSDHRFWGDGPPLLFETMVFESHSNLADHDGERYSTWEEAMHGHAQMCRKWRKKPK